jgi:hypothetical protein
MEKGIRIQETDAYTTTTATVCKVEKLSCTFDGYIPTRDVCKLSSFHSSEDNCITDGKYFLAA